MQEKKGAVNEFAVTLRAAAAAVGHGGVTLDRDSPSAEVGAEREARITELRRQYLDGAYGTDPTGVAAAIIDEHIR
jgi:anti-sigma28 factor (negative regulator of flagellin synthesis)